MLSRAVACSGLRLNLWPLSAAAYSTIVEQWVADNPVTIQQVVCAATYQLRVARLTRL